MGVLATKLAANLAAARLAHDAREGDALLYGFAGAAPTVGNYYAGTDPSGEVGDVAGFVVAIQFYIESLVASTRALTGNEFGSFGGYQLSINSSHDLVFAYTDTVNAALSNTSTPYRFTVFDIGKVHAAVYWLTPGSTLAGIVSRTQIVSKTTAVTYKPNSTGRFQTFGSNRNNAFPAQGLVPMALATFRGVASAETALAYLDEARSSGDLPAKLGALTLTHRWPARDALRGVYPVNGQTAPASVPDVATGLAADSLARVGSPTVKTIDTSVDGRRAYGVHGFTENNYLISQIGAGILGVGLPAFHFACRVIWHSVPTGNQVLAIAGNSSGGTAWYLRTVGAALTVTGNASSAAYTVTAADVGVPINIHCRWTGTALGLYVRGTLIGEVTTTIPAIANSAMRLGHWTSQPFTSGTMFDAIGGHYSPTTAEIAQCHVDSESAGMLMPIAGMQVDGVTPKTRNLWRPALDIVANGGTVPDVVLDRIGTDHLTRVGITVVDDGDGLKGVGPFTSTEVLTTLAGGGLQGANAMHVVGDLYLTKVATNNEVCVSMTNGAATTGYYIGVVGGLLRGIICNVANSTGYTVTAADLNKRIRFVLNKTTSVVQLWLRIGTAAYFQVGSDVAAATYNPPSSLPFLLGNLVLGASSNGWASGRIETVQGGNSSLTTDEIATIMANMAARPPRIIGKTTLQYPLVGTDGKLPARVADAVTGAAIDTLTRTGAPLQVAQRVERVYAWERSPIIQGFTPGTYGDVPEASGVQIGHTAESWWISFLLMHTTAGSGGKRFVHRSAGNTGFLGLSINGTSYSMQAANGAGTMTAAPAVTLATADLNKLALLTLAYDSPAGRLRSFYKRAEVGTGTVLTGGYTPDVGSLAWGAVRAGGGSAQIDSILIAACGGVGVLTIQDLWAHTDAVIAEEDMSLAAIVPGKTRHLWSLKGLTLPDTFVAGQTMIPDRIGTAHFVMTASVPGTLPTRRDVYTRSFAA